MKKFTVPGQPKGKGRPRFTERGHVYTPQATRDYELYISKLAMAAGVELAPAGTPVGLRINCYFSIPVSWSKARHIGAKNGQLWPMTKPDIDNISKVVMDALNGIAYEDDKQVVCLEVNKAYAEEPRV